MKAELLFKTRLIVAVSCFVDIKIWRVPKPVRASSHDIKYSLALIADGICVLRYDNEVGKGDHKHVDGREIAIAYSDLQRLQDDFWKDVDEWIKRNIRP